LNGYRQKQFFVVKQLNGIRASWQGDQILQNNMTKLNQIIFPKSKPIWSGFLRKIFSFVLDHQSPAVDLPASANVPASSDLPGMPGVPGARVPAAPVACGAGEGGGHRPLDGGDRAAGPPRLPAAPPLSPPPP
jgi:hypothetical protein